MTDKIENYESGNESIIRGAKYLIYGKSGDYKPAVEMKETLEKYLMNVSKFWPFLIRSGRDASGGYTSWEE
jgi:hypothetical protein